MRINKHISGSILIEFLVSLNIMMLLVASVVGFLYAGGHSNRKQWARQECIRAATAQLDSLTATGQPVDPNTFECLWPHIRSEISLQPGSGQWEGLVLAEVKTARRVSRQGDVVIELRRYLPK